MVNRNSGRLVAVWISETVIGSRLMFAMNQPVAVSNIAMPKLETVLAVQITVKAALANAPQRTLAPGSASVGEVAWLNILSRLRDPCRCI